MACNASKAPFLRVISKRGFSATPCPRPIGQTATVQTSVLANKVIVASTESALPVSRVSVVFRAGSRSETYETQGASHMLRICAGLSTQNSSGFAITRNIQQVGGSLTVTSDRETFAYTVETTANQLETGLCFLQDVIEPAFKPWELADSVTRIRTQVAGIPPQVRAVELLHKAAFRTGLGNSLYMPKYQIGKLSPESMLHFVGSNCTGNRCAVVGIGIDHNTLSGFAQNLSLGTGNGKTERATYHGGDARKDLSGHLVHIAVAGQGGGLINQKEALTFAVLQRAVGGGASTKRGNMNGSLGKALTSAIDNGRASFATINANYAETGLFGFIISTDVQHIAKAVELLVKALKSGTVSSDDVNRAKIQVKNSILDTYATESNLIAEMGIQAVVTKQVHSAESLLAAVDAITQQDVQEAAKKVASSKLSIGAVGNLAHVPYSSDLA